MIGFLPTPNGPFHVGTLSTYFAAWCLSRRRQEPLVVVPDVSQRNEHKMDDIAAWARDAKAVVHTFGLDPDRWLDCETVWANRSDEVPAAIRLHMDVCLCGQPRPYPTMIANDPCSARWFEPQDGSVYRLRRCGVWVATQRAGQLVASDVLEHLLMERALGLTTICRARDLVQAAWFEAAIERAMGWTPIESVFHPVVQDEWYQKMSKTNGSGMAVDALAVSGFEPIEMLRALWAVLQVRGDAPLTLAEMARQWEPARIHGEDFRWEDVLAVHRPCESVRLT